MAVRIDLRRDLPKALAMKAQLIESVGNCLYAAPCVIGAMVNPKKRKWLDTAEGREPITDTTIRTLVECGVIMAPKDQMDDLISLQGAFDDGDAGRLDRLLGEVEAKYINAQAHA